MRELLDGKLPIPAKKRTDGFGAVPLNKDKWHFGDSMEQVARQFLDYWTAMTNRGDKFRVEGASLIATAVFALTRVLADATHLAHSDRESFVKHVDRLKRLSLSVSDDQYREKPMKFWRDGREIAEMLLTDVQFITVHGLRR